MRVGKKWKKTNTLSKLCTNIANSTHQEFPLFFCGNRMPCVNQQHSEKLTLVQQKTKQQQKKKKIKSVKQHLYMNIIFYPE